MQTYIAEVKYVSLGLNVSGEGTFPFKQLLPFFVDAVGYTHYFNFSFHGIRQSPS